MAIFGKKKSLIDELWEAYEKLPNEDKESFKAKLQDVDKAEDKQEIDEIEEDKADSSEEQDKKEEVKEESEKIGKSVDGAESEEENALEAGSNEEDVVSDVSQENADNEGELEERGDDMWKGFDARLKAIEDIVLHSADKTEDVDAGISGYGKYKPTSIEEDTRVDDMIRGLGGRVKNLK